MKLSIDFDGMNEKDVSWLIISQKVVYVCINSLRPIDAYMRR